jgi:hypothetical protein
MAIYNRNVNRSMFQVSGLAGAGRVGTGRSAAQSLGASARVSRISVDEQARRLADQIIAERDRERRISRLGKIYTRFDEVDDVLANNVETVTRGLFSGNVASLTTMAKSTALTAAQERYYYEIQDSDGNTQFSIAYGNFNGSGSAFTDSSLNNDTPARAIYKQYAQTLLGPTDKKFTFDGTDSDSIYVLNFNRARIREKLDPGNFEITLRHISASAAGVDGAEISSSNHIQIIDDSSTTSVTLGESGQVYNLVSGSIDSGTSIYNASNPVHFGLLYPQYGVAVLDATQLDKKVGAGGIDLQTNTANTEQYNIRKLFTALSSSAGAVPAGKTGGVQARSAEQVKSTYYFVRAKNAEFNYSNNPSFVTGSLGQLAFNSFKNDPQVYITSVGLYNDRRELLAVAKLSQPLLKNYTREALIKVKLDF